MPSAKKNAKKTRKKKKATLSQIGVNFARKEKIEEFYSDSRADTPLAEIAQKAFLVKGERLENW